MSQDLVRQYPQQRGATLPASADDVWMHQNSLAASQNAGGGDVQPLKLVHRSLRGRYKIAALLAAVGAAVGMAVGWTSFEKTFRAKGYVRISPEIISLAGQKEVQSDYTRYMGSEAVTLRTSEIASNAMANAIWVKAVDGTPWEPAQFASRVQARFEGSTNDIVVSFDHPNRDVAVAGMRSVLAAYEDYRATQRREQIDVSAKYLEQQKREIQASIESSKSKIAQIKRDDAKGNIDERALNKGKRLAEYQNRLDDERFTLERMEAVKAAAMAKPTRIDEAVLARREPFFARLLVERDNLSIELARLQQVQGPNSPPVQKSRTQLATITGQISAIAEQLSKGSYGVIQRLDNSQAAIEVTDFELANRADTVALLKKQVEAQEADLAVVDSARFEITELTNQIDSKMTELEDLNGKLAIAQAKSLTVNAPFRTFPDPVAAIAEDKRPTMATFGFVVGAGLPLMGLVLFGLMDRKYRYSDEATASGGTRGVALLGILPNLPDRLSDPSQASVAAHCVHQIRTMLQLNCLDDGPSVLAVTSATSGDGKTSLSLALGLSFAASGSRTLLIDTDLIGAGLSARLGIREPSGISEAIVDRNPMQYVRDTDVTDLSVLPVGIEGAQNASAFSPTAVRRLLAELRKHFDLVLIDTGPVLGSIEATPIVAASDAVILTVARGQNRDLVEKAINHLRAVGARIAGVVFNRANARDFERSISGISLRSVSRASANGTNGQSSRNGKHQDGRLGPLVHSVRGTREDVA